MNSQTSNNIFLNNTLIQRIVKVLIMDSQKSYKFFLIILIILMVAIAIVLGSIGTSPINVMPWDVIILLDGGWRIINGQIPHVDFYSPLGPLPLLLTAFGMKIAPPSASSIVYGNILFFIVLTLWSWFIARSRLSAVNAFIFTLFMGFLLIAPRALGDAIQRTSYAMLYNKQGFVLLSMLFVELLIPLRTSIRPQNCLKGGISSGILVALLLFCKINYFGIGVITVLIAIFLFRHSSRWLTAFFSSFFLICLIMQIIFNINLNSLWKNVNLAAQARNSSVMFVMIESTLKANLIPIFILFSILIISSYYLYKIRRGSKNEKDKIIAQIGFSLAIFSGLLICAINTQENEIPTFFIAGLIWIEYLRREIKISPKIGDHNLHLNYLGVILIIIPLFCGKIFIKDIGSVAYSALWHKVNLPKVSEFQRLQSTTLHDLIIPESANNHPGNEQIRVAKDYPKIVNDGLTLLRKHISNSSRILSMSFSNPFPFALELPSPRHSPLWWHNNITFSPTYFPDPHEVFNDVDIIIMPKFANPDLEQYSEASTVMKAIYEDYLNNHFIEKESSQFWILWVKQTIETL